jgi:hypothetical protein
MRHTTVVVAYLPQELPSGSIQTLRRRSPAAECGLYTRPGDSIMIATAAALLAAYAVFFGARRFGPFPSFARVGASSPLERSTMENER